MIGVHVICDKTRTEPRKSWEVLMQVASIKLYQRNFGSIRLYCCKEAYAYLDKIGVLSLYNSVELLDYSLIDGINREKSESVPNLLAQLQCNLEECIFLDPHLLITNEYTAEFLKADECGFFYLQTDYESTPYEELVVNCSFNLWKNKETRRGYASSALRQLNIGNYINTNIEEKALALYLIEQEIIYDLFISNVWNTKEAEFLREEGDEQLDLIIGSFNHIWGNKEYLHQRPIKAADFTVKIIELLEQFKDVNIEYILNKMSV